MSKRGKTLKMLLGKNYLLLSDFLEKYLLENFLAKISLFLKAEYKIEGVFEKG